jgi:hypothetical protein
MARKYGAGMVQKLACSVQERAGRMVWYHITFILPYDQNTCPPLFPRRFHHSSFSLTATPLRGK